jgi:hypothetical protein
MSYASPRVLTENVHCRQAAELKVSYPVPDAQQGQERQNFHPSAGRSRIRKMVLNWD